MHQAVLYQMLGKADEVCNFIFLYKVTFLFSSQSVAHIEKSQNLLTNEHKPKKKKLLKWKEQQVQIFENYLAGTQKSRLS